MKGDFTRDTFHSEKHYRQVLMQQGRVQLDADWNEQAAIGARRDETTMADLVSDCGGPADDAAFGVLTPAQVAAAELAAANNGDFYLSAGKYYVDGIQCEVDSPFLFSRQPDHRETGALQNGSYLLYLDVWHRHLIALDDGGILDPALGGVDTSTRMKTVWQVRAQATEADDCSAAATDLAKIRRGQLPQIKARTTQVSPDNDPCTVPESAGYRGLENQLYRVEIHEGSVGEDGKSQTPTFKWSRENGSIVTAITDFNAGSAGTIVTVASIGPDQVLGFRDDDIVELLDDGCELEALPGKLARIDGSPDGNKIKLKKLGTRTLPNPGDIDLERHPKLRRWEGVKNVTRPAENDGYLGLESGVEVRFDDDGDSNKNGDFWLIPARAATPEATAGDIEWPRDLDSTGNPRPLAQPPRGIAHHYCQLGIVTIKTDVGLVTADTKDCRCLWPALTTVPRLFYVSGDGQEVMPDLTARDGTLFQLPHPLVVGMANGQCLDAANPPQVEFRRTLVGTGEVKSATGTPKQGPVIVVPIGADGLAICDFLLDGKIWSQQVTARLLDAAGQPVSLPLIFNANLSVANQVAFDPRGACPELSTTKTVQDAIKLLCELRDRKPGIVVTKLELHPDKLLLNDSDVRLADFVNGIDVFCDGTEGGIDPVSTSRATAFVTLEIPLALDSSNFLNPPRFGGPEFGFQPVILAGVVRGDGKIINWTPTERAKQWLENLIPKLLPNLEGNRLLVRLTLKGNFIWDVKNPDLFLDGDVFGRKRAGLRQDVTSPDDHIEATSANFRGELGAASAIDNQQGTKYQNFDRLNTGFTVTPSVGPTIVSGLTLTSANDRPECDPATFLLEGTQDGTTLTRISSGPVPVFTARFEKVTIPFANEIAYRHYRLIFPEVVGPGGEFMHISEVELLGSQAGLDRTDLRLMPGEAGDGRRGGDFEMWFWLVSRNQPPTISTIPAQRTPMNVPVTVNFSVSDVETPAAQLIVTSSSSNHTLVPDANLKILVNGANRALTVAPAAGQIGVSEITVSVADDIHQATATRFLLTVEVSLLKVRHVRVLRVDPAAINDSTAPVLVEIKNPTQPTVVPASNGPNAIEIEFNDVPVKFDTIVDRSTVLVLVLPSSPRAGPVPLTGQVIRMPANRFRWVFRSGDLVGATLPKARLSVLLRGDAPTAITSQQDTRLDGEPQQAFPTGDNQEGGDFGFGLVIS